MTGDTKTIQLADRSLTVKSGRLLIMGILNVTPDSFSDGGSDVDATAAADRGAAMIDDGADIIDVGPESTRPGSQPVHADEQIRRAVPVIQKLRSLRADACISVDTRLAPVAEAALDAGADMVNDISAGRDDPELLPLVAARRAGLVLMHMQNTPATMQQSPHYDDVVAEVKSFLVERQQAAVAAGVNAASIVIDPGIGFGKTVAHNLALLRDLESFTSIDLPVLLGCSRKRFLMELGGAEDPKGRLAGSLACAVRAAKSNAAFVRVHDVRPTRELLDVLAAIQR